MRLSGRAQWHIPPNRLALARDNARARGAEILDLTESNPTRVSLAYPLDELSEVMARAARARYHPEPRGLTCAREALAMHTGGTPDDLILTASTSEAYAFLFALLADPGEAILTPSPSYPLLDHLARLQHLSLDYFPLDFQRRWEVDVDQLRQAVTPRTRAVAIVNPNNPTGSYVSPEEQDDLAGLRLPLIADEVFFDFPLDVRERRSIVRNDVLTFTLGGLSKSCGLPHYKLAWIRVSGPDADRRKALEALELIADSFLSVSTPVQEALPDLLRIARTIRAEIAARIRENLDIVTRAIEPVRAARLLAVEGGWSAVIRIPRLTSDEEFALRLLEHGVLVHPGYFFDFAGDGFIVVSLLPRPEVFTEGVRHLADMIGA